MLRHHFLLPLLIILGLFASPAVAQEGGAEAGSDGVVAAVVDAPTEQAGAADATDAAEEGGGGVDAVFATLNSEIGKYVFYPIPLFGLQTGAPRSWDATANGGAGDWVAAEAGATIPATLPLAVLILMLGATHVLTK